MVFSDLLLWKVTSVLVAVVCFTNLCDRCLVGDREGTWGYLDMLVEKHSRAGGDFCIQILPPQFFLPLLKGLSTLIWGLKNLTFEVWSKINTTFWSLRQIENCLSFFIFAGVNVLATRERWKNCKATFFSACGWGEQECNYENWF